MHKGMPQKMERIPIIFEHKGLKYCGQLWQVHGAGQYVWHLMTNGFFFGALLYCNGWVFDSIKMSEMAGYFGDYVTAWYQ
jgi:hypothetical protein